MFVFLSSVTYALREERDALAAVLSVVPPYQPIRFEDFTSQDRSPRQACLAGVDRCDVYVLLLGPRYGDPLPDSGMAPTEEEFAAATRQDKPVLVFTKTTDEPDEPRQAAFKHRVEDYVNGKFRASFTDPAGLNLAVLAALRDLNVAAAPLAWQRLDQAAPLRWSWDVPELTDPGLYGPVLDVHLVPVPTVTVLASRMQQLPATLARTERNSGFFTEGDHLTSGSTRTTAWGWLPDQPVRGAGFTERREHDHRGVAVRDSGQVVAFQALPTDFIGALVDQPDLQRRAAGLLAAASRHLPDQTALVAVAASLAPLDRVFEGDPAKVTGRTSGSVGTTSGARAIQRPELAVSTEAINQHTGEIAAEIAAALISALRAVRR